jgi:hypothetical protein
VGGAVDSEGSKLPMWLGDFLRARPQSDVLDKLFRSTAPHKHACVFVTMHGAPWPVYSYLVQRRISNVPSLEPNLPAPVTGAWIISNDGSDGIYWDGVPWHIVRVKV